MTIPCQINPVLEKDNIMPSTFEVFFVASVPALGVSHYTLMYGSDGSATAVTVVQYHSGAVHQPPAVEVQSFLCACQIVHNYLIVVISVSFPIYTGSRSSLELLVTTLLQCVKPQIPPGIIHQYLLVFQPCLVTFSPMMQLTGSSSVKCSESKG